MKNFLLPVLVAVVAIILAFAFGGLALAWTVALLAVLEVSLSFDNAVINASVLRRMNSFWQTMFMTVGMLIAVVGMRLIFPVAIVALTAKLGLGAVVDLVWHHPADYATALVSAHPAIVAFGGMFLWMIFLDFLLDEGKRVHWAAVLERPLAAAGRLKTLSTTIALMTLLAVCGTWAGAEAPRVLLAGVIGLVTYLAVRGLATWFEQLAGARLGAGAAASGQVALFLFVYLELLDASFSFDGVVGAFALTTNVLAIALGLGIGALCGRELTVWLVRHDSLREFRYLEHGAHYAVGALAVLMAASLAYDIPEALTGFVGAGFIGGSLVSSHLHRRRSRP